MEIHCQDSNDFSKLCCIYTYFQTELKVIGHPLDITIYMLDPNSKLLNMLSDGSLTVTLRLVVNLLGGNTLPLTCKNRLALDRVNNKVGRIRVQCNIIG